MTRWGAMAALALVATPLPAQELPIRDATVATGSLGFDGHATVGDFTGLTREVSGAMRGAPDLAGVTGWVTAPVASLQTGNGRRDRDLRKSMEPEQFPDLRFDLLRARADSGTPDSLPVSLLGRLTLHGVTREVDLPAVLAFDTEGVRVRCDFPVNLKDYGISGLSKVLGILKMDEHIEVHVDLRFQSQAP
jgi:polyisoprenoid-binding protein YceI